MIKLTEYEKAMAALPREHHAAFIYGYAMAMKDMGQAFADLMAKVALTNVEPEGKA